MKEINTIVKNQIDESFFAEVKNIIEQGRGQAYAAVSRVMIDTYWKIGERIVQQEQRGKDRADYGTQLIAVLSNELTTTFGKGFSKRNLQYFRAFYLCFSDLEIVHTRMHNLSWSHIRTVLRVDNPTAARWYMHTASQEMWSVRTLDRNISTQYYERHFQQPQIAENLALCCAVKQMQILQNIPFLKETSNCLHQNINYICLRNKNSAGK